MKSKSAQLGRPRAFDPDVALDRAMHVFGPKVTKAPRSPTDAAMRINRPSLYAAFGNKEQLFRKVSIDMRWATCLFWQSAGAAKARDVIEQILLGAANMASDPRLPAGCLMVQGALACGIRPGLFRRNRRAPRASEIALRRRLQRAKREGIYRETPIQPNCSLRDDRAARMAVQEPTAPTGSATASRPTRTARVAEALARRRQLASSFAR